MKNILQSDELISLYKKGYLDDILIKYNLNEDNYLGAGGDASAFEYDTKQVIKICSKKLSLFKNNVNSTQDFLKISRKYKGILLQVNRILYEDEKIFIYTQDKCSKIKKKEIVNNINHLFNIAKTLISNNVFTTSISPHNLTLNNEKLLIFDYHSLHFIIWDDHKINHEHWFRKIFKVLYSILAKKYLLKKRDKLEESILNKFDSSTFKLIEREYLPKCYLDLLYYVTHNNVLTKDKVISLITKCIQ